MWELTPLYLGEVISVWAFGVAWLLKARDLWKSIGPSQSAPPAESRARKPMDAEPTA
jgi:hypothetical protein